MSFRWDWNPKTQRDEFHCGPQCGWTCRSHSPSLDFSSGRSDGPGCSSLVGFAIFPLIIIVCLAALLLLSHLVWVIRGDFTVFSELGLIDQCLMILLAQLVVGCSIGSNLRSLVAGAAWWQIGLTSPIFIVVSLWVALSPTWFISFGGVELVRRFRNKRSTTPNKRTVRPKYNRSVSKTWLERLIQFVRVLPAEAILLILSFLGGLVFAWVVLGFPLVKIDWVIVCICFALATLWCWIALGLPKKGGNVGRSHSFGPHLARNWISIVGLIAALISCLIGIFWGQRIT